MLSASNSLFVKPWLSLRWALTRRQRKNNFVCPARFDQADSTAADLTGKKFLHFLTTWGRFCSATDCTTAARPDKAVSADQLRHLALDCVDALEALDPAPCPALRQQLSAWQPATGSLQDTLAESRLGPLLPNVPQSLARNCTCPQDTAAFCHARAVGRLLDLAAADTEKRVRQLRDGVPKQFWALDLGNDFNGTDRDRYIEVGDISSPPMQALWRGMNALPWQGPPAVNGRGFLSVLFEATANPQLDPAAQKALFYQKNHFLLAPDYCYLHSRFGFHVVAAEARLTDSPADNHLRFQLQGGAANLERRRLRALLVADLLTPFGFRAEVRHDAVAAWCSHLDMEEGRALAAIMGYIAIHTRQLDMIMQDTAEVAARRATMLAHCQTLLRGQSLS